MKRRIAALLFAACALLALASCHTEDEENKDNHESSTGGEISADTGEVINTDDYFFADGVELSVILSSDSEPIMSALFAAVHEKTDVVPVMKALYSPAEKHEIVFGSTSRDISKEAYRLLAPLTETENTAGYLIYSDGTSVAVAFSTADVLELAYDAFLKQCLQVSDGKITLSEGVIASGSVDLYEYFDECDEKLREEQWATLEKHINAKGYDGAATVAAFKQLYSLYSDDAYLWLANLYDPATGGFYYSNSARDTVTFAPDLESTRQALDFLRYSGMTRNLKGTLPAEMKTNLVAWVQSLRASNGYFYHPQWEKHVTTDERLGRDVTNARSILDIFDAAYSYSAYSGAPGVHAVPLTGTRGSSKIQTVSASASAAAPHLSGKEAFLEYLNEQNWNDAYTAGNRIAAQFALIREAGLADICLDFLDGIQNPETGMWSPNRDDNAVNGFLKISAMYADYGRRMNYMSEAADTCIAVLLSDTEPTTVCWVYNVWYSLGNIIGLLNSENATAADRALANDIRDRLCKNAPQYITVAYEKYLPFRKEDGSFSFTPEFSSNASQGMPVCVSRMREGDVNASYISIVSVPARIFAALGYQDARPDIYTPNDYKKFLHTLAGIDEVVKTNHEYGGALGFNGASVEGLLYEAAYTEIDTKPGAVSQKGHSYAYIDLDEKSGNQFLTFGKEGQSILENGGKVEPKIAFRTIDSGGTRYIYEAKVRFNGGEMEGNSWHTRFSMYYSSGRFWYMLAYTDPQGKLCLDSMTAPLAVLEPGVWYDLRFEYYTDSAASPKEKVCRVYVNGEYVGNGGVSGSAGKDSALGRCYLEYRCQATGVSWSLDDVNTTTDTVSYAAPTPLAFGDAAGEYADAAVRKMGYGGAEEAKRRAAYRFRRI